MSLFIDEVTIYLKAGDGGNGSATFRTEKHVPRGGPDGGDGGRGGSLVFQTNPNLSTLIEFRPGKHYKADSGGHGMAKKMFGKNGGDMVLSVPPGTQIWDVETGEMLADLDQYPQKSVICAGGKGGRGNTHFVSSVQQAPKFAEKGEPGEERKIKLELKLLADVGLLGFPNVGKSTLLSRVSAARPKIADYPFTTLVPNLGVVRISDGDNFVMADIPGVIEGASDGAGLGIQFLKHLERTRLLVHLLDLSELSGRDPLEDYEIINKELARFSETLAALPQVLVLSRIDVVSDLDELARIKNHFEALGMTVFPISSVTGDGIEALKWHLHARLQEFPKVAVMPDGPIRITAGERQAEIDPRQFSIECNSEGIYVVSGKALERAVAMTDMDNEDGLRRLQRRMHHWKVFSRLKAAGAQQGDTVRIQKIEFVYIDEDAEDDEPLVVDEE